MYVSRPFPTGGRAEYVRGLPARLLRKVRGGRVSSLCSFTAAVFQLAPTAAYNASAVMRASLPIRLGLRHVRSARPVRFLTQALVLALPSAFPPTMESTQRQMARQFRSNGAPYVICFTDSKFFHHVVLAAALDGTRQRGA